MSFCHTSWTLLHADTQTHNHTRAEPRWICQDLSVGICGHNNMAACVCLCVFACVSEPVQIASWASSKLTDCQWNHLLTTRKQKYIDTHARTRQHTHANTQLSKVPSINSQASKRLLILRWLTFPLFEVLPIKDFFLCRDLSVSQCMMLRPTLHLLHLQERWSPRSLTFITLPSAFSKLEENDTNSW